MRKKRIITIIVIILILLLLLGFILFFTGEKERGSNPIRNFFPFGKYSNTGTSTATGTSLVGKQEGGGDDSSETEGGEFGMINGIPNFFLITKKPVAAFQSLEEEGVDNTEVRYILKSDANIYKTNIRGLKPVVVSEAKIPQIHDGVWSKEGDYAIVRYLSSDKKDIKSYLMDLSSYKETEDYLLSGEFLTDNIRDITLGPNKDTALIITDTNSGSALYNVDLTSGSSTLLYTSPISEWLISESNTGDIYLTSKASEGIPGYLFKLSQEDGSLSKILTAPGLTTLPSPGFHYVLYSESRGRDLSLNLYNTKTGTSTKLGEKTLPDKCTWANDKIFYCGVPVNLKKAKYPDVWYMGGTDFQDNLMKFIVGNPSPVRIFSLGKSINISHLQIVGNYAYFLDKNSSSLWGKRVTWPSDTQTDESVSTSTEGTSTDTSFSISQFF